MLKKLPFISDLTSWVEMWSCDKAQMLSFMKNGENIGLLPGGFQEATLYKRGKHRIFIKDRKGFVKYALQYGYQIVPCYIFGEENTYWPVEIGFRSFRLWLNKYNIPGTLFIGKYLFLPDNNIDINIVVGAPMKIPMIAEPTAEEIDKYHTAYIDAVKKLFERYKGKYAAPDAELQIF
jgi:2-acylglycerol O-acyltransferase 2